MGLPVVPAGVAVGGARVSKLPCTRIVPWALFPCRANLPLTFAITTAALRCPFCRSHGTFRGRTRIRRVKLPSVWLHPSSAAHVEVHSRRTRTATLLTRPCLNFASN